jgi:hypothetical protein
VQQLSVGVTMFTSHRFFFFWHGMAWQPWVGQGLIVKASRSHSDTPLSIGLLWMSDQLVTETSTWHTPLTRERHPCPQRNLNPSPSKRAAAAPCLRLCGYWDQLTCHRIYRNFKCDAYCIQFNSISVVRWLDVYKFHNFIDCTITVCNSSHVLLCSACIQQ